ncbi:MAG: MarR family transcriptional regulator [Gemmatimonadetes bacterium]|nr:MarR family transcriptional regulator [Gemmatimonadota bacterium]
MIPEAPARPISIHEEIQQSKPFRTRSQEAFLALLRTADDMRRRVSQVLEPAGVTLQQYNVLRILRGAGPNGLATLAIAERMVERTPGVTRLIDRMEEKGWVTRERCTEDRRRVWCRITEQGLRLLAPLDPQVNAVDDSLEQVLEQDELAALIRYLDLLRDRLNQSDS